MKKRNMLAQVMVVLLFCVFWGNFVTFCSNGLSLSHYSIKIHKGQTFYIRISGADKAKVYSDDEKVATVSKKGYIYAVDVGKTSINAEKETGEKVSCEVSVLDEAPIRFLYYSPNVVLTHSQVELIAITDAEKDVVRFELMTPGAPKTIQATHKEKNGNTLIWKAKIHIPLQGKFKLRAHSKKRGGGWENTPSLDTYIVVSNKTCNTHDNMVVSDKCVEFLASCEGFIPKVYEDKLAHNIPTIGYGKTLHPGDVFYNNITKKEAYAQLLKVVNGSSYSKAVNNFLNKHKIKFNQHQFDALVSFTYNVGSGWTNKSNLKDILLGAVKDPNASNCRLFAKVNSSCGLNVRKEPSTSSDVLSVVPNKSTINIVDNHKHKDGWYKVRLANGKEGYVFSEYVSINTVSSGDKNLDFVNKDEFIKEFASYHHAGKKCLSGLLRRRYRELDMFLYGKYLINSGGYSNIHNYPKPDCMKK